MNVRQQVGVTLIELVVSIVIIAIAVGGILSVFSVTAKQSADVMVREQATAIGEAYLEEIMLKPFADPDGVDGETDRADYDDIEDYNALDDIGAHDQFGTLVAGLDSYNVHVEVTDGNLNGLPVSAVKLIDVLVTQPTAGVVARLNGYRANY